MVAAMNVDPAVRSVRIAVTLCERFAELLKGPATVTARKQSGALFGVSGNDEALSLRIGEVQQIYPEIWRHLDEARAAFASRGIDVSAYDQIRAREGVALGAAVDVKHTRHGAGQYAVDETVKSANFNVEGHRRAREACEALMRATPDIDWAGIARAEAEDPNIKAFTRSTTARRWIMLALLAGVLAAPFLYVGNTCREKQQRIDENRAAWQEAQRLSDAERTALANRAAELGETIAAARRAWPAAFAPDALAAVRPGARTCPVRFAAPTAQAAASYVEYGSIDANYFGSGTFASYQANEPIGDDQLASADKLVAAVASRAARGEADRMDQQRLRDLRAHVFVLVIDREMPGEVTGRAYVYDIREHRIVCAGTIAVRNEPRLVTAGAAKGVLHRDLEVQLRTAFATGLGAVD